MLKKLYSLQNYTNNEQRTHTKTKAIIKDLNTKIETNTKLTLKNTKKNTENP